MQHLQTRLVVSAQNTWFRVREGDGGQSLVEYALIVSVVALGVLAALVFLRDEIKGLFSKAGSSIRTN